MNTDDLDRLLNMMLDKGFVRAEIADGHKRIALKLATSDDQNLRPGYASPVPKKPEPQLLKSSAIGILLDHHPLESAEQAGRLEGSSVTAGTPIAYIQSGNVLNAIIATMNGRLGRRLCQAGDLVGYGTAIFEIYPENTN